MAEDILGGPSDTLGQVDTSTFELVGRKNQASGYAGLDASGNVPLSKIAVLKNTINPFDDRYGAVGDGVTDDTAAWLAATADLFSAGSGHLVIPPNKVLYLNPSVPTTPARIPPNTDPGKRFVFQFFGGSHLKMSTNMPVAFQPGRTTDGQTFRGLDFIDFAVDRNNVAGYADVIFGPTDPSTGGIGVLAQRNNYRDIRFIRPRVWNVPALGNVGAGIHIIRIESRHVHTNEGDLNWDPFTLSQSTILDILLQDPEFDGGDYGLSLGGDLQMGSTIGARIKNFAGTPTVLNFTGASLSAPFTINEWVHIGTGKFFERHRIIGVVWAGDGTGSLTLETALTFAHPTEDATGAGKGSPVVQGKMCNVWCDRIRVSGGYHIAGTAAYGSNILIGESGIGGHDICVENIRLEGSGDNALEIDTVLGATVKSVHAVDSGNQGFLSRNFHMPQNQDNSAPFNLEQTHTYEDCAVEIKGIQPTTGAPSWGWLPGYNWQSGLAEGATPLFGTVKIIRGRVVDKSTQYRSIKGRAVHCGVDSSLRRLEGDVIYVKDRISDAAAAPGQVPSTFLFSPNTDAVIKMLCRASYYGTGSTNHQPNIVEIYPYVPTGGGATDQEYDILVEARSGLTSMAAGATRFFDIGNTSGTALIGTFHGRLGAAVLDGWTSNETGPKLFVWGSNLGTTKILNRVLIDRCDTSRLNTAQIHIFPSPPAAFQRKIFHTRNNLLLGTFSNFTGSGQFLGDNSGFQEYDITPGASPWTFINETTVDLRIRITGGTVSAIDSSYNSGSNFQTGKLPVAIDYFNMRPGEALKVTYTVAPSVFAWPLL